MGVTSKYCEVSVLLQPWKCKPYQVIRDEDFIFKHKKQNKPPSAPLPLKSGPVVYHVSGADGLTVILLRTQSNLFTQVSSFNVSVSPFQITW